MSQPTAISRVNALRVAGLVPCDPRTVSSYFSGARTTFAVAEQIRVALKTLGIEDPRPVPAFLGGSACTGKSLLKDMAEKLAGAPGVR